MNLIQLPDGGFAIQNASGVNVLEISADGELTTRDSRGEIAFIGRGTTDLDITFMRSKNADAEDCYIYGNAAQNAITVAGTRP